jgi:pimeloyl-ACP methyl ester carboxylesterase
MGILLPSHHVPGQTGKSPSTIISDKYVVVDGHKMHYHVSGSGSPTVVFEGGVSDNLNSWNPVFSDVAKFTRAVSYDRMGLGTSEASSVDRSFKQMATELHSLLKNAQLPPPYILVGHSMGGPLIRAFAHLYKNEISGMLFIDCGTEFDNNGYTKDTLKKYLPPESVSKKSTPQEAEFYLLRTEVLSDYVEMKSFDALPDVPIRVFVGQKNIYPQIANNRMEWYTKVVSNQAESSLTVLPTSSHYIHRDYPGLVVAAIHELLFPNADIVLAKTLQKKGVDSCIAQYKKIKAGYPPPSLAEGTLNKLGYQALNRGETDAAIALFELNTKMYPDSFNVFDSLGEAYMKAGNKDKAIKNYEKSIALNPSNTNAGEMLKKIKGS